LSEEELGWTYALREALAKEGIPEPPGGDLMLAQFAIIGKGNLKKELKRVKNFHNIVTEEFEYSTESALPHLGWFARKWPGMMLGAGTDSDGAQIFCCDMLEYLPAQLEGQEEIKMMIHDFLLMMEAMNADLDDVRKGVVFVTDAGGIGWNNINMELEKKCAPLYQDAFPCKFKSLPMVNPGRIMTAILALFKLFLKKKMRDRIILTKSENLYKKHGYTLDMLPSKFGGTFDGDGYTEILKARMKRRLENVANFTLPPPGGVGVEATPPAPPK